MEIYVIYEHYHPNIHKAFYEDLTLEYLNGHLGVLGLYSFIIIN